jgi:hypothetical protein
VYINTITITLTIAPEVLTELNSGAIARVIVIVLIYMFNRAELGNHSQSYSDSVDIQVLSELNSGAIVRV